MTKVKEPDEVSGADAERPNKPGKRLPAIFFRTRAGSEPVRDWLKTLP
jgi:hypothetical protein